MVYECEYCKRKFNNPITSGHKRKCPEYLKANPPEKRIPLACLCGHESTSLTQMKRHRVKCQVWNTRNKNKVSRQRLIKTLQEKYGENITNPIHIPESKEKAAITNMDRYGAKNVFSKESSLYEKVQSYWNDKDRTKHLPKNNFAQPEVKEKIKKYWHDNHGVSNSSQVPHIRQKQLETNKRKYGDEQTLRVESIREKIKITNIDKFGSTDPMNSELIKEKVKKTNMERYGVPWTTLGMIREKQYESQIKKYGSKFFASEIGKRKILESFLSSDKIPKDGVRKRKRVLNRVESLVQSICPQLVYTGNGTYWKYLKKLGHAKNPDFIIPGPDPYHPFKNVTKIVEVLGVYWHGFSVVGIDRTTYESHLFEAYKDIGITALIIWEDETWSDLDNLKSKLLNFIESKNERSHIENQTEFNMSEITIQQDSHPEIMSFLNEYHYGGFGRSGSIIFSARLKNNLIAVAKFSPPVRQTISESLKVENIIELDRFCIHPNHHKKNLGSYVLSKVIKIIKKSTNIEMLVSFADPEEGHAGTIYKASNWKETGKTSYSYYYLVNGAKMNKKTLYDRARKYKMNEREYAEMIGAERISLKPKTRFIYDLSVSK